MEELRSLIKGHNEGAVAKRKSVVLSAVDPDPSLAADASRTERAPIRGRGEAPSAAAAELHSRRMSARLPPASKPTEISISVADAATSELQAQIAELKSKWPILIQRLIEKTKF